MKNLLLSGSDRVQNIQLTLPYEISAHDLHAEKVIPTDFPIAAISIRLALGLRRGKPEEAQHWAHARSMAS